MPTESELQALVDKDAIRDVLYRYARAVDRGDSALLRSCYHADATADYGRQNAEGSDAVEAHLEACALMHNWIETSLHCIGNVLIELDGDVATVESYLVDTLRPVDADQPVPGQQVLLQLFARYVDRFEKRDGQWRIARRVTVQDMSGSGAFVSYDFGFRLGRADMSDVVYDPLRR